MKTSGWSRLFGRSLKLMTGPAAKAGRRATRQVMDAAVQGSMRSLGQVTRAAKDALRPPPGPGDWLPGGVLGPGGARGYRLYRPPVVASGAAGARVPLLVMLHGCGQDAKSFAVSTRMNRLAARHGFLVLYPEQDRLAHPQGCWHWFDTDGGRAAQEVALIMKAIDQVCLLYPADRSRVAVAGMSAGAGMAALLATRHPGRFRAVVMHSGVPPGLAHSPASAVGAMQGRKRHTAASAPAVARGRRGAVPGPVAAADWPPLLVVHGGADPVVAVGNAHAAVALWASAAQASARPPKVVQRGARYPMVVTEFKAGARTAAQIVQIERLGHAWSGGDARQPFSDARGPDASRLAWAFIARQMRD